MYTTKQQKPQQSRVIFSRKNVSRSQDIVQYKKSEFERGQKHKRVNCAISLIKKYAEKFDQNLQTHIFIGEITNNTPKGLHAYTNNGLSSKALLCRTIGNENRVHKIFWKWKSNQDSVEKESTMFPKWMPENHVKMLIATHYPKVVGQDKIDNTESLKTYISHGLTINIAKRGNTIYPTMK